MSKHFGGEVAENKISSADFDEYPCPRYVNKLVFFCSTDGHLVTL